MTAANARQEAYLRAFREDWLAYALSAAEYEQVKDFDLTLLRELYPGVWRVGPDYYNMRQFDIMLLNALGAVETSHTAAQLMNKFKAAYYITSQRGSETDWDLRDNIRVQAWTDENPIIPRLQAVGFFDLYSAAGSVYDVYRQAVRVVLHQHLYADKDWFPPYKARHDRFVAWVQAGQVSDSPPAVRALFRLVTGTGTASDA